MMLTSARRTPEAANSADSSSEPVNAEAKGESILRWPFFQSKSIWVVGV